MVIFQVFATLAATLLCIGPRSASAFLTRKVSEVVTLAQVINPTISEKPTFDNNGSNFDIAAQLFRDSNLIDMLSTDTSYGTTLLIPNDLAANTTAADLALASGQAVPTEERDAYNRIKAFVESFEEPKAALSKIVLHHVLAQERTFTELTREASFETMSGEIVERIGLALVPVMPPDGIWSSFPPANILPGPMFRAEASNGYLYVIDRMMFPQLSEFRPIGGEESGPGSIPSQTPGSGGEPSKSVIPAAAPEVSFVSIPSESVRPDEPQTAETPSASPLILPSSTEAESNSTPACFPISSVVHLSNGSDIPLTNLSAGHVIKSSETHSSMVYLFTHKKHTGLYDFVRIITERNHEVVMTKGHYIYANGDLKAAGNVRVGDTLRTLDGPAKVRFINRTQERGLFAPHTLHGDIVVNRVITSSYTTALNPRIAHVVLWPLRALVYLGLSKEPLGSVLYAGANSLVQRS